MITVKLLSCECHRKPLMISQHWFGYWLGALNSSQQAITRVNNDPDLRHHMASLGQIAFRPKCISPKQTVQIKINTLWLGVHFNNNHSLTIVIQMEMSCSCNCIPGVPIGIISLYPNLDKSKIAVRLKFMTRILCILIKISRRNVLGCYVVRKSELVRGIAWWHQQIKGIWKLQIESVKIS